MVLNSSPGIQTLLFFFILVSLCKTTVPILLGLCRSLGRFCTYNDWLVGKLFPPKNENDVHGIEGKSGLASTLNNQGFSNFR